jgi:hypothetical protein
MCVFEVKNNYYSIQYNTKEIENCSFSFLLSAVFHELGHILEGWDGKGNGGKDDVKDEYLAEKYSIKMIKKYYPGYLPEIIAYTKDKLKDSLWCKENKTHAKAYSQIKEYQD